MEHAIQDPADSTLGAEKTRGTPRGEEPGKEKGEPTEQPNIHKLGRTRFLIYIHGIHRYVKGGVGGEAVRRAYVMMSSEVGAEGGVLEEVRGIPEVKEATGSTEPTT